MSGPERISDILSRVVVEIEARCIAASHEVCSTPKLGTPLTASPALAGARRETMDRTTAGTPDALARAKGEA